MKLNEIATQKLKSIQYLVSKGYPLKKSLVTLANAPKEVQIESGTKRVIKYTLLDKKQLEVDSFFLEYGPIPTGLENQFNDLLIH